MNDCGAKRVVALVDMDCFYCQVEVQHNQSLIGKPVAVVQYNSWRGGGIIAVNYEARAKGVNRHMRGDDAVQACPDLNLVRVKELHGKADLSKYRTASQKVFEVLSEFSSCVQRASIDEAYVDLTSVVNDYISTNHNIITENDLTNTFVEGYSGHNSEDKSVSIKSWLHDVYNNELQDDYLLRLTIGAMMVEKLRKSIFEKTGFRCSAGIANNKILSKLACGLHKPNQQTLLPPSSVPHLFESIPIKKIKNLGGKLGNRIKQEFNCKFMSDLAAIPLNDLQKKFNAKTCNFLCQISKGIDHEPVESRIIPKSIGSCKSFPIGLKVKDEIKLWLNTLINDIVEKLNDDFEANKRKATLMTVSVRYLDKNTKLPTSQCFEVTTYNHNKLLDAAFSSLCTMTENQKSLHWKNPISFLGIAIGKFLEINAKSSIDNYFNKGAVKEEKDNNIPLPRPEKSTTSSKIIIESDSSTPINQQQFNTKANTLLSNHHPSSLNYSKDKKKETCTNDVKNLKTMFAQMKDSSSSSIQSSSTLQNKSSKKEIRQQYKHDINSFFTKKLEIISPVKNQVNGKITTVVDKCSSASSVGFLSESSDVIYPTKKILKDNHDRPDQSTESFFSKKLEIVSPTKHQKINDSKSVPIVQSSITKDTIDCASFALLCERCNKMIEIDAYDEHIDHHVALELSESLNTINPLQPLNNKIIKNELSKKKKNESGKKRKHNSKASSSNSKKPCTSISSYFKPLLNP
ncbi:DNA polymerase eta-like [Melanaphis sacchari]|uniref:DNA polymerase eta n=1 Tax=Melanaphis sacchari TaxID=742174 RepID=A0A2H8TXN8_9HEMI|nr:DNA polymerase eta-like [Melanaphis sacchari]XP_025200445.1 DNA polymerase eta-like [Melanaphis sacchari]